MSQNNGTGGAPRRWSLIYLVTATQRMYCLKKAVRCGRSMSAWNARACVAGSHSSEPKLVRVRRAS